MIVSTSCPPLKSTGDSYEEEIATISAFTLSLGLTAGIVLAQDVGAKLIATGTFHGKVHETTGRATVYQGKDDVLTLRLTNFETSNGPDVHVILIAADDAKDDANFISGNVDRTELVKLKGNVGDQNYSIPAGHGSD